MTKFLLIRHALTDSVGKRLSGRFPGVFLNAEGREQSIRLVKRFEATKIHALYCSPLERAVETCRPIAEARNLSWSVSDHFIELDFGRWTNSLVEELRNDPEFILFNNFRSRATIPEGENMPEAQLRIISGLLKLGREHMNETVAVVSHADMIKSALAFFAGIHLDMMYRLEISPASVSILELSDHTAKIILVNDTHHLYSSDQKKD